MKNNQAVYLYEINLIEEQKIVQNNTNNNTTYTNSNHNQVHQGDNSITNFESKVSTQQTEEINEKIEEIKKELVRNNKENYLDLVGILEKSLKEKDEEKAKSIFENIQSVIGETEKLTHIWDWLTNFFN